MDDFTPGFFFAFEGTDGCGKGKVSRLVSDKLKEIGYRVTFVPKISPPVSSGYATYHLTRLKELLWQYEPSAPLMDLGEQHWLHLIVAWFHAMDHCSIEPALRKNHIVITDGWYYKYLARFSIKSSSLAADFDSAFSKIRAPSHVVHLDVDPVEAEWRMQSPSPSETGLLDDTGIDEISTFVQYQSKVRRELLKRRGATWTVIETKNSSSVDNVVEKSIAIVEEVLAESYGSSEQAVIR